MTDSEALQGLWKIESMRHGGQAVGYSTTHWEFDGNRVQEIVPDFVGGGEWATFVLDPTATPKRIDKTYEFKGRDGKTTPRTFKEGYELNGDVLKIGGAQVFGQYPAVIDETYSMVTILTRDTGPRPQTKQASGKEPVENPVLGTVTWNDNLNWWEGSVLFAPGQNVRVSLTPLETGDEATVTAGADLVEWARAHDKTARNYAARQMVELAEDWRDEDENAEEITPASFAARIKLTEVTREASGEASFWYDDDAIFGGHVIVVSLNAAREFTDAQMMG